MGLGWARHRRLEMGRVVRTRWISVSAVVWPLDALAKSDLNADVMALRATEMHRVCVYTG